MVAYIAQTLPDARSPQFSHVDILLTIIQHSWNLNIKNLTENYFNGYILRLNASSSTNGIFVTHLLSEEKIYKIGKCCMI